MIFADIIQSQSWTSVEAVLTITYHDYFNCLSGFMRVFNRLRTLEPQTTQAKIHIDRVTGNSNIPFDVYSAIGKQNWSLTFVPWAEVLGMGIDRTTLTCFSLPEIVAHVLWTITFFGFDEETINRKAIQMLKDIDR